MPARSNDFQAVVYFIRTHIAADAEVKESAMLSDRFTGDMREVDVCVAALVGGERVVIGIECRDHQRKADLSWVDSMYGKHQRLPTNKLVLVSRSGFTKAAAKVAKLLNIEAVTPNEPIPEGGPLHELAHHRVETREVEWRLPVQVLGWVDGEEAPAELREDHVLFTERGTAVCNLAAMVNRTIAAMDQRCVADLPEGDGHVVGDIEYPQVNGNQVHLLAQGEGVHRLHRLVRLRFAWPITVVVRPIALQHGELHGTKYVTGSGAVVGHDAMVVITGEPDGPNMSVRLADAHGHVIDLEADRDTQSLRPRDSGSN